MIDRRLYSGPKPWHIIALFLTAETIAFLSALVGDPDSFARFGTVVVAAGIFFVSLQIYSLQASWSWLGETWREGNARFLSEMEKMHSDFESDAGSENWNVQQSAKELRTTREELEASMSSHREAVNSLTTRLVVVEAFVIGFGTVQNGYGDLWVAAVQKSVGAA